MKTSTGWRTFRVPGPVVTMALWIGLLVIARYRSGGLGRSADNLGAGGTFVVAIVAWMVDATYQAMKGWFAYQLLKRGRKAVWGLLALSAIELVLLALAWSAGMRMSVRIQMVNDGLFLAALLVLIQYANLFWDVDAKADPLRLRPWTAITGPFVVVMRGLGYSLVAMMIPLFRAALGVWRYLGFVAGMLLVGMLGVFLGEHAWPMGLVVPICLAVGGLLLLLSRKLTDGIDAVAANSQVLQNRLRAWGKACLRRPRVLAAADARTREILSRDEPFTLLLRDHATGAIEIQRLVKPFIPAGNVVALMDPGFPPSENVLMPVAPFFSWGPMVLGFMKRARTIVVVAYELTPGLAWELRAVAA